MSSRRPTWSPRPGVRRKRPPARRLFGALGLLALMLASCGLGPGRTPSAIHLTVTQGFGTAAIGSQGPPRVRGQESVMSLLVRNHKVKTRYGGGFVQRIDGHSGGTRAGDPVDWFYYVNGVEASKGAADTNVHAGDRIWWDLHDWSQTDDVPAVVGSFPEPFLDGLEGKRYPLRVECTEVSGAACRTVRARLRALGVRVNVAGIGGGAPQTLRVLVGAWPRIGPSLGAQSVARGPRASGIYALFSRDGRTLTPLDQDGARLRPLGAGTGLIAATRRLQDAPIWVITGTDDAGVQRAASSLDERTLRDRFAVALTPAGPVALPRGRG
jgi:hypothetical protein